MTIEEARKLSKGDYILYNNKRYKVLNTQDRRRSDNNEIYVCIKCTHGVETLWLPNKFAEVV